MPRHTHKPGSKQQRKRVIPKLTYRAAHKRIDRIMRKLAAVCNADNPANPKAWERG